MRQDHARPRPRPSLRLRQLRRCRCARPSPVGPQRLSRRIARPRDPRRDPARPRVAARAQALRGPGSAPRPISPHRLRQPPAAAQARRLLGGPDGHPRIATAHGRRAGAQTRRIPCGVARWQTQTRVRGFASAIRPADPRGPRRRGWVSRAAHAFTGTRPQLAPRLCARAAGARRPGRGPHQRPARPLATAFAPRPAHRRVAEHFHAQQRTRFAPRHGRKPSRRMRAPLPRASTTAVAPSRIKAAHQDAEGAFPRQRFGRHARRTHRRRLA